MLPDERAVMHDQASLGRASSNALRDWFAPALVWILLVCFFLALISLLLNPTN